MNRKTVSGVAILCATILTTIAVAAEAQGPPPIPAAYPPADPNDVGSLDGIVAAIYESISGAAGVERNWERWRSLFMVGAKLIFTGKPPNSSRALARSWSVEEYIRRAGPVLVQRGFFEREIGRATELFGNIGHVFSTYESRNTREGEIIQRGINSIQLFNDGERWWIMNILWDSERPDSPIPEEYVN